MSKAAGQPVVRFCGAIVIALTAFLLLSAVSEYTALGDKPPPNREAVGLPDSARQRGSELPAAFESRLAQLVEAVDRGDPSASLGLTNLLSDGRVRVIVACEEPRAPELSAAIRQMGVAVEGIWEGQIQCLAKPDALEAMALLDGVLAVHLPPRSFPCEVTEALGLINADEWHAAGLDGAGVKVGVLDSGFAGYADLLGTDLPSSVATHWALGGQGADAHGTACAEIIHDIVPAADLYLATYTSPVDWYTAADWLISQGVDVISCSIGWLGGPRDGTSIICEAIEDARAAGVLWIQSAGNYATNHWKGQFRDSNDNQWHEFSASPLYDWNAIWLDAGDEVYLNLTWDDTWGAATNDYDLFLFCGDDPDPCAWSLNDQASGYPDPTETISYAATSSDWHYICVSEWATVRDCNIELFAIPDNGGELYMYTEAGSICDNAASPDCLTVGAVDWANPDTIESYSSRGPTADGRTKPDLVGPVWVSTESYGTEAFGGTSAATPHVAGAAALLKQAFPEYGAGDIQNCLESNAVALGSSGKDNTFGSGRVRLPTTPTLALVSMSSTSAKPGESAVARLHLHDVDNMGAFTLGFTFDPTLVQVVTITQGDLPLTASTVEEANSSGRYIASWLSGDTPQSGDFLIATIVFEAIGAPGTQSGLEVFVTTLVDFAGQDIDYRTRSGTFQIEMVYDFGDAPLPYQTTLAENGAQHGVVPGFHLGSTLDWESDGQPDSHANGDDVTGSDDEDGVEFTSTISPGRAATVDVTASDSGYLDAWMDFNNDGDWVDVSEHVFSSEALSSGVNSLSFDVPLDAVFTDSTFARFRFSSAGGLSYDGLAPDGEVEDYEVAIEPVPPDPPTALQAVTYSPSEIALTWSSGSGADTTIIRRDTSGYPASPAEGFAVYSGAGTSCIDSALTTDTLYYYSAWSYHSGTGLVSDTAARCQESTLPTMRNWTVMVYLDADNNLEGAEELDLDEMMSVGSTDEVSILVQHDRYSESGTWRYYVADGALFLLDEMAEQNMGDPDTLSSFVDWATAGYPASNYALVLWDHGSGALAQPAPEGVIYDDTDLDFLSSPELAAAVAATESVDLLGFDACLMQMYEVSYELALVSDPPDVVVGSEDTVPGTGWPYDAVLDYLIADPGADAIALGSEIVSEYIEYPSTEILTLSAVELPNSNVLASTLDALSAALIASDHQAAIATARANAQSYSKFPYRDMVDFCDLVLATVPDCATEAQAMKGLVASMVVAEGHTTGAGVDDSHGLSIYLPETPAEYDADYDSLALASATWWDDFLRGGYDYGDAPDPFYPTLSASDGARHVLGRPWLGATVDAEVEALPDSEASGDDEHGDDEDGVTFLTPLSVGHTAQIEVTASSTGFLDAWIDFNADGDWTDTGEQIFSSEPLAAGLNSLSFAVPQNAVYTDSTFARFRISSTGGLGCSGLADDGEVEDYHRPVVRLIEGDVTRDNVTNIVDAMFIAQYTVGLRDFDVNQLVCADTNDDGTVNIVDAMHIAQYTVDPMGSGGVLFKPLWEEAFDPLTDPPS